MDLAGGVPSRAIYELPQQTDIFGVKTVCGSNFFPLPHHSSCLLENQAVKKHPQIITGEKVSPEYTKRRRLRSLYVSGRVGRRQSAIISNIMELLHRR